MSEQVRRGFATLALCSALGLVGCPAEPVESIDAARPPRRDASVDASRDSASADLDAFHFDAAPPACEGVTEPEVPCTTDAECLAAGYVRCRLPITGNTCSACMGVVDECRTDDDCEARALADAGTAADADAGVDELDAALDDGSVDDDAGSVSDDAGEPDAGMDAGPLDAGPPTRWSCVTYDRACACPRHVCEPACEGPTCPNARCDVDGYACPPNSVCDPDATVTDDHGCAPRSCATNADCACGFCSNVGLCANGVGTCEV